MSSAEIAPGSDINTVIATLNNFIREQNNQDIVKVFKQAGNKNAIVIGRLPKGGYGIIYYDDQGKVIRVDGFIPSLAVYPVTIIAKYGSDVYTDILGI